MTRHHALLVGFVLLAAHPASSQWTLGLVAGGMSSSASSDGLGRRPVASISGFTGGVSLEHPLTNTLSLAPELLFATKGSTDKLTTYTTTGGPLPYVTGTSTISYLEVPILLRVTATLGALHPFVAAGPEVALRVGCNFTVAGDASVFNGEFGCSQSTIAAESGVKRLDVGAMVGAGLALGRMLLSVRYDIGVRNYSQDPYGGYAKNRAIMAVIGITR